MKRLDKVSLISIVVGLVLAVVVVPWSLLTITESTERLRLQQEQLAREATSVPSGERGAYANQQSAYDQAAQRELDGQTARRKVPLGEIEIPRPASVHPAYSVVPPGSPELVPLDGWVDQPNKDRPGRVHTNLKWRWANKAKPKPSGTVKVSDAEPMLDEPPNTRFEPGYVMVAWSGADDRARERAKPRGRDGEYTKTEQGRKAPPPKGRQPHETQTDAQRRHPQSAGDGRRNRDNNSDRSTKTEAQRRHPRPDGRYDRNRSDGRRDHDRYSHRQRQRWDRDRFPRSYFGIRVFDRMYYRGRLFGPHDRLWCYDRHAWRLFYWPYPYAPAYGCGRYYVPIDRRLVYDPYSGEEYWDYTDYQYVYFCFDS